MNTAELAIRITADADDAVRAATDVGDAYDRMASDVDDASRKADTASGRFDGVAESADHMASKSSQAAGGLGDLGGALSALPGPLGALGTGMETLAPSIMGVTGAADLVNLAMESNAVVTARAKAASIAHAVASKAQAAATKTVAVAQRILNLAMRANPIGLAITAALALAGLFVLLYKRSESFRRIVDTVMDAVKTAVGRVIDAFQRTWDKVGEVASKVKNAMGDVKDAVQQAGQWVRDKLGNAFGWVLDKVQPIVDAMRWIIDHLGALKNIPGVSGGGGGAGGAFWDGVVGGILPGRVAIPRVSDQVATTTTKLEVTVLAPPLTDPTAIAAAIDKLLTDRRVLLGGTA